MRYHLQLSVGFLLFLCSATWLHADNFDPHQVPSDAKWVVHVDVDAIQKSQTWQAVEQRLEKIDGYEQAINMVNLIAGVKFPDDIHDVTVYGRDVGNDAWVLIAHADIARIEFFMKLAATGASDAAQASDPSEEDPRILSMKNEKGNLYVAFNEQGLIIVSPIKKNAKSALTAIDSKIGTIDPDATICAGIQPGQLVYVCGRDLSHFGNTKNDPMNQLNEGWVAVSEEGAKVMVRSSIVAKTAEEANAIQSSLETLKLQTIKDANQADADADTKAAASVAANVTSKVDARTITIECPISIDLIRSALDQIKP